MDTVWLIDCGDAEDIIQWLEQNKKSLAGIFLTHSHFDHIYGLNELKKVYPAFKVYASSYGIKGLYDPKLNMSFYHDDTDNYVFRFDDVYELKEANVMALWPNTVLEVMATHGHDRGCLTYRVEGHLFTGDSYIPGVKVVTNFPQSNKQDAEISREKILCLQKTDNLMICAGHIV